MKTIASAVMHGIGLVSVALLSLGLFYASRFWIWKAPWGNDGLLGLQLFSPYGSVVRWWTQGTVLSEFNIILWGCGSIILLSLVQWLASRFSK
ncbi:MAG: hypothetical protein ACR2PG_06745 [Hyphomicrobiaceae bacterium]